MVPPTGENWLITIRIGLQCLKDLVHASFLSYLVPVFFVTFIHDWGMYRLDRTATRDTLIRSAHFVNQALQLISPVRYKQWNIQKQRITLHAPPISPSFISLPKQRLAKSTNDDAPNHVIFATFPLISHTDAIIPCPIPHHPSPVKGINKQSWF